MFFTPTSNQYPELAPKEDHVRYIQRGKEMIALPCKMPKPNTITWRITSLAFPDLPPRYCWTFDTWGGIDAALPYARTAIGRNRGMYLIERQNEDGTTGPIARIITMS